jgi:hypothetical protein
LVLGERLYHFGKNALVETLREGKEHEEKEREGGGGIEKKESNKSTGNSLVKY